ncbi:MAG: apolipoprotein N-acyltransferase [Woeseiaceae bacterium]|nr:apolipoprotein N-acyltransferase [Woeseiaceae bacterium]
MPFDFSFSEFLRANLHRAKVFFLVLGASTVLAFAPFGLYPLALLALLPLLYVFLSDSPREAARYGFCFGAGLFLAGTYWLYNSIHIFGGAPLLLAIFLMLALVAIMGLYYAAAGWLTATLAAGEPLRLLLAAPAVWVVIEWFRGWFLSGFPWLSLGYSQIDSPLAGLAPVVGIYGVSLAVVLSATAFLVAVIGRAGHRVPLALLALAPWIAGYAVKGAEWTEAAGPTVRTTIVQGGISQDRKWLPEQFRPTLSLYRESLVAHPDSQIIVWPEVAIPSLLNYVEDYVDVLQADLQSTGRALLFGILEQDDATAAVYNSVVRLDGVDRQIYRKRHLVPFGEFFPVPDFVREWMRLMNLPYSDISPGDAVQPLLRTPDGQQLAVAICYEDAYASEQLYALPDATILINVSNDAWFGDSIAPYQHLEIARMRALEAGRPAVRATNTGISAFISADGAVSDTLPQFSSAVATAEVQPRQGLTPYARFGNLPVLLLLWLALLLLSAAFLPESIRRPK